MYTYEELLALFADLADPTHRLIAGYSAQELRDLAELILRAHEQIAAELATRKEE